MPAKIPRPWEVLVLDISELDQRNQKLKKCQVAVVDINVNSTLRLSTLYCCGGGLKYVPRYMEIVIRSDAWGSLRHER